MAPGHTRLAATETSLEAGWTEDPAQPARMSVDNFPCGRSRAIAAVATALAAAVGCTALAVIASARHHSSGEDTSSFSSGLTILASSLDVVSAPRFTALAPICFTPLANIPGHSAVHQGKEILSRQFSSISECSRLCTEHSDQDCNSFTACIDWDMCFLKDKVLAEDEKAEDGVPGGCMSFRAVPCMLGIGMQPATVIIQPPPLEVNGNRMIFYMYRAQGAEEYPLEDVNMADLAGLMWYLHSEVLQEQSRKFGVTRILRYKVAVKNPLGFFGKFMAYKAGDCLTKGCLENYQDEGFEVGCQPLNAQQRSEANYVRDFVEVLAPPEAVAPLLFDDKRKLSESSRDSIHHDDDSLHGGVWFSLPKNGHCTFPTGDKFCTYSFEAAGEIALDELVGILDPDEGISTYEDFSKNYYERCLEQQNAKERDQPCVKPVEYDFDTDKGVRCSFWDERRNVLKCQERMEKVRALFGKKYPKDPTDLGTPSPEMCPSWDSIP